MAKSVTTYKFLKVEGDHQTFKHASLLWFLAINQEPQVLNLKRLSERFVVEGQMDELGHYHLSLTKEYAAVNEVRRIVNTLTWRDDPVLT